MGTEFHFGMMKRLWSQIVVTVVQQCECTLIPQNYTLKNGKSDTYVFTTIKKKEPGNIVASTDVICILPWTICKVLYFLWKNVALEIKSQIIEREYSLLWSHT